MALSDELEKLPPIEFQGIEDETLKQEIIDGLLEVNDPEIHIDIVNLGLVYEVHMDDSNNLKVKMTLTAMGCPLAGSIANDVKEALQHIEVINEVEVDIVWNPPWTKEKMSRLARMALGIN